MLLKRRERSVTESKRHDQRFQGREKDWQADHKRTDGERGGRRASAHMKEEEEVMENYMQETGTVEGRLQMGSQEMRPAQKA